jgi:hypothetical protein
VVNAPTETRARPAAAGAVVRFHSPLAHAVDHDGRRVAIFPAASRDGLLDTFYLAQAFANLLNACAVARMAGEIVAAHPMPEEEA